MTKLRVLSLVLAMLVLIALSFWFDYWLYTKAHPGTTWHNWLWDVFR